ncbi:MAG TPA: hypothetical protein DCP30_09180 [Alistipes sp.]|nr:hypothetical protein [Alistipes sp.]
MQGRAAGNPMAAMGRERSGVPKGTDMAEEGRDSACRGNRTWQRRAETRRAEETGHGGGGQQKRTGRRYAVRAPISPENKPHGHNRQINLAVGAACIIFASQ